MPNLVASDVLLQSQAKYLQAQFANGFLRLYTNALPPSPANVLRNFAEAFGAWYTPALFPKWTGPTKVQNGEWSLLSPEAVFINIGPISQTLFGWFYTTALGVLLSAPFPAPITLTPGGKLGVQVLFTDWATFTLVGS